MVTWNRQVRNCSRIWSQQLAVSRNVVGIMAIINKAFNFKSYSIIQIVLFINNHNSSQRKKVSHYGNSAWYSFCKCSFSRKNLNPNTSVGFQYHPNLIVMLSSFLNGSSWSSWNILTFGGFRRTLIISRTPSETFEKGKRSVEHVLISW